MGREVGQAECHECYIKFPKTDMKRIEIKGNKSGSSFSIGKSGMKGARFLSGRQYYRKVWICNECQGGGCLKIIGWFFVFAFLVSTLSK
jgi:hypothetical protein